MALCMTDLWTVDDKLKLKHPDPMELHLLSSKVFKCLVWFGYLVVLGCVAIVLWFDYDGQLELALYYVVVGLIVFILPLFSVAILSSKKLAA